jgi:hypothetical protein
LFLLLSCWLLATCLVLGLARVLGLQYCTALLGFVAMFGVLVGWPWDAASPARPIRCVERDCEPTQQIQILPKAFEAWEAQQGSRGRPVLLMVAAAGGGVRASYNATSTRNGERLVISDLAAATFPGGVTGCRTNLAEHARIPLSAAVNASARFPIIDPPGALAVRPCEEGGQPVVETVADGGFHDNFGAASLLNVLEALQAGGSRFDPSTSRWTHRCRRRLAG